MRRKDREIPENEARALLESCEYGYLSLVTPENTPYSVPVNHIYINEENAVYIHCATEGKKLDCIAKNTAAQFSVTGKTKVLIDKFTTLYESAMAFGDASLVEDDDEKRRILMELCRKYMPEMSELLEKEVSAGKYIDKMFTKTALIKLTITSVSGKANKGN